MPHIRGASAALEVKDIVTRPISGHATETMQHHYSTVATDEKGRRSRGLGPIGTRRTD
jgi:hypothetical protein